MKIFLKRFPLTSLIAYSTTVLAVLVFLQSSGTLTGSAAHWADVVAGVLQVALTAYARQHVTPVIDPKDENGRELVPADR
jgi:hypothetical protein